MTSIERNLESNICTMFESDVRDEKLSGAVSKAMKLKNITMRSILDTLYLNLEEKGKEPVLDFMIYKILEKFDMSNTLIENLISRQHVAIHNFEERKQYYHKIANQSSIKNYVNASRSLIGELLVANDLQQLHLFIDTGNTVSKQDFHLLNGLLYYSGVVGPMDNQNIYLKINNIMKYRPKDFVYTSAVSAEPGIDFEKITIV